MRIRNTSQYPTEEVRALVEFATRGVNMAGVAVHVKNAQNCAYRGRAYERVPRYSPEAGKVTVVRLVTVGIGTPERFPADNMATTWKRVGAYQFDERPEMQEGWKATIHYVGGREAWIEYRERVRHPYGGKRSPLIEMADWREGLLAVAAHEANHIAQFRHGKPRSEVACERFAAKRLQEWRATR